MTDLEITRLCAEAMGLPFDGEAMNGTAVWAHSEPRNGHEYIYTPLTKDAQAMALVKKCVLGLAWSGYWSVYEQGNGAIGSHIDLNRAICECVAKMQSRGKS